MESHLRWFDNLWKNSIEALVKRVDQSKHSPITRGKKRPRKTIGKTIKKNSDFIGRTIDIVYDRTLQALCDPYNQPYLAGQSLIVVISGQIGAYDIFTTVCNLPQYLGWLHLESLNHRNA